MSSRYRTAWVYAALIALFACAGCRRVQAPEPEPTADEFWQQGEAAMAAGEVDRAAELYGRALAMVDDVGRRRRVAVHLAAAGGADAGRALLGGRGEPALVGVDQAIELYAASPPLGHEDDPFVIGAMADALAVGLRPMVPPEPINPTLLEGRHVAALARRWGAWLGLHAAENDSLADTPARAMALWVAMEVDAADLAARGFIVHRPAGADPIGVLYHMGSWPIAAAAAGEDAVIIPDGQTGPVVLYLATWGGEPAVTLAIAGHLDPQGRMVIEQCSHPDLLAALLATETAAYIAEGVAVAEAELPGIYALAERIGKRDLLTGWGGSVMVRPPEVEQTDFAPDTRWLDDLVAYTRYGRPALAALVESGQ